MCSSTRVQRTLCIVRCRLVERGCVGVVSQARIKVPQWMKARIASVSGGMYDF